MPPHRNSAYRAFQLRQSLLSRIGRRYQVASEEVDLGGVRFSFTRVADPDRVLDEMAAEADLRDRLDGKRTDGEELHLPYWAELWDSARGIGMYLAANRELFAGRGNGTSFRRSIASTPSPGTPGEGWGEGLYLPDSGKTITPTLSRSTGRGNEDRSLNEKDLIQGDANFLMRIERTRRLRVLDLGCGMGMAGAVAAALGAEVVFADLEPPALLFARLNSLPWRRRIRTRQLNWQRDHLDRQFDLIIGADILYERAQWPYLEPFWRRHLAEGGQLLLGEPGRQTGDLFLEWIVARDWRVGTTEIAVTTRPTPIRVLCLVFGV